MSPAVVRRVTTAIDKYERELDVPLIVENSPLYFSMPGSTLSQVEFINQICSSRTKQRLLLDIVHLEITCQNLSLDPLGILEKLPLDRVDEVHLSGYSKDRDLCWDDHASAARESTFTLLNALLSRCAPKAITLEYNWNADFPTDIVRRDVNRVRQLVG